MSAPVAARLAIAGQPAPRRPVPDGEVAAAIAAVARLCDAIADETFPGILDSTWRRLELPFEAFGSRRPTGEPSGEAVVVTRYAARMAHKGPWGDIAWRWRVLWTFGGEEAVGWHPDRRMLALRQDVARRLWDVLNPGKRLMLSRQSHR